MLKNSLNIIITESGLFNERGIWKKFCYITGVYYHKLYNELYSIGEIVTNSNNSFKEVIFYYQALLSIVNNDENRKKAFNVLKNCLNNFKIKYNVIENGDELLIFPPGDSRMDNALVVDTLLWMDKYPDAKKMWKKAIKLYDENDMEKASEIADLFRKTLETFFKEFFNINCSLENSKSIYGSYLKDHGITSEISNNLVNLISLYCDYNNHCAKHNDNTNKNVLEYIMYQTGNIMRLLFNIKNSNN